MCDVIVGQCDVFCSSMFCVSTFSLCYVFIFSLCYLCFLGLCYVWFVCFQVARQAIPFIHQCTLVVAPNHYCS